MTTMKNRGQKVIDRLYNECQKVWITTFIYVLTTDKARVTHVHTYVLHFHSLVVCDLQKYDMYSAYFLHQ